MVIALILSRMTRIAPAMMVNQATCRLYQPDTRSMWSLYQFSIEVRTDAMSSSALVTKALSEFISGAMGPGMSFWLSSP